MLISIFKILIQAAKDFAQKESIMENNLQNLKKMEIITTHMNYQYDAIKQAAESLEYTKEQVNAMERWMEILKRLNFYFILWTISMALNINGILVRLKKSIIQKLVGLGRLANISYLKISTIYKV